MNHAGAEARALDLEDTLRQAQRQTAGFDEAQSSLIEQSTLLVSKNAELQHKLKSVRATTVMLQHQADQHASTNCRCHRHACAAASSSSACHWVVHVRIRILTALNWLGTFLLNMIRSTCA